MNYKHISEEFSRMSATVADHSVVQAAKDSAPLSLVVSAACGVGCYVLGSPVKEAFALAAAVLIAGNAVGVLSSAYESAMEKRAADKVSQNGALPKRAPAAEGKKIPDMFRNAAQAFARRPAVRIMRKAVPFALVLTGASWAAGCLSGMPPVEAFEQAAVGILRGGALGYALAEFMYLSNRSIFSPMEQKDKLEPK